MKKILLISPELEYTGALNMLLNFTKALKENNYAPKILSYEPGPFVREFDKLGVLVEIIDENDINEVFVAQKCAGFDMVVANTICTQAFYYFAKDIIPAMWYIHEGMSNLHSFTSSLGLERFKESKLLYSVSEYSNSHISKYAPNAELKVLLNCLNDDFYLYPHKPENKIFKFLSLGTIEKRKGYDLLIDAFLDLPNEIRKNSQLHFAGRKYEYHEDFVPNLFEKIKGHKNIIYHGELRAKNEIYSLINSSDIFVAPSRSESCSMVSLEAAMMATPVILTKEMGAKYIAENNAGFIVEAGSVESLKNAMIEAFNKRSQLKQMGQNARENYLKTSTFDVYKNKVKQIIEFHTSKTPYEYRISLKDYKLYSFDVFDTLITRKVARPIDIFKIMQEKLKDTNLPKNLINNFAKIRRESELFLYSRYLNKHREDITFSEIYSVIKNDFNLTNNEQDYLMNVELQTEKENILPIQDSINIIKKLLESNKRVILISNMYLSSENVRELLSSIDPIFNDICIYVSSEFRAKKTNSKLYKIIQEKEQVSYKNWIHYGDDFEADFIAAKKLNIDSMIYGFNQLKDYELNALNNNIEISKIIALSRNIRLKENRNPYFDFGVSYGGNLLMVYVNYVIEMAIRSNIENLIFIARDGFILQKIADKIILDKNLRIKTHYFYTSRVALSKENLDSFNDYLKNFIKDFNNFAFVEWSGTGTTMNIVLELLKQLNSYEKCIGVYYVYQHLKDKNSPFYLIDKLFSMQRNFTHHIFECLCRSIENQTIDYIDSKPVFSNSNEEQYLKEIGYSDYIDGVLTFVDSMISNNLKPSIELFNSYINYTHEILETSKDKSLIEFFGNIPFCVQGDFKEVNVFAPRLNQDSIQKARNDGSITLITNNISWSLLRNEKIDKFVRDKTGAINLVQNSLEYQLGLLALKARGLKLLSLPIKVNKTKRRYIKRQDIEKVIYELKPQLKPQKLETYIDYKEAIEMKNSLTYKLGEMIKRRPFLYLFKIKKTKRKFS